MSQGSLQGDVCAADLDLLSDSSTTVNGLVQNGLSEDFEVSLEPSLKNLYQSFFVST